mmetsp:Transcript_116983/g.331033  ORF Transcript_116983/g.331033 Transcript_116983/m.331033 type:complete len:261 (-) Transcript_116983:238-1020(-)
MGCGTSDLKDFRELPPVLLEDQAFTQLADRVRAGEEPRVHLVGIARPAGRFVESPFGAGRGFAAALTAHHTESGLFARTSGVLFRAKAAVSFRVGRGDNVVDVDVSPGSRWTFTNSSLSLVHTENNIDRTGPGGMMKGGGEPGHRSDMRERPDGLAWWQKFNNKKDPPDRMQSNGRMLARSRVVKEYWLREGDPVAVVGTLRKAEDGTLRLVGGSDRGLIANVSSHSKALKELSRGPREENVQTDGGVQALKFIDDACRV